MKYDVVIGLEVHVELKTRSKLFCGCQTSFGSQPNTQCCPVCLGLPGSLPVLNRRALELAIIASLALNCTVAMHSRFDRKNYFYPDLPKAYQISQYDHPLGEKGYLKLPGSEKRIGIARVHLEEEAGKLIHPGGSILEADYSMVDYNRAGIPLLEIVSEPQINSPLEARLYLEELRLIMLYTGVSDCRMEEGSLRCDANISLKLPSDERLGTKVEVKNMNSFRNVELALAYEAERQAAILNAGGEIEQETRHWDEITRTTISLRGKEEASDYRYFPEPDLPPFFLDETYISKLKSNMPELPAVRRERFCRQYSLEPGDIEILVGNPDLADFYEQAAVYCHDYRELANWVNGEILRIAREEELPVKEMDPLVLAETIGLLQKGAVNRLIAKNILSEALIKGEKPADLVKKRDLGIIGERTDIEPLVQKVLSENGKAVESYLHGKKKSFDFLVGRVMALTGGRADPSVVNKILKEKLDKRAEKSE